MTVAYSYLRYSSKAQRLSHSLKRQLEAAELWAAKRPDVILDTTTRDLGVSAFKGEHRVRGALSSFLDRIKTGQIAPGSYLLVETFDRLSRESEMVAVNLLSSIVLAGVRVVTLRDGHEYHEGSDGMDIMRAVIVMSRAHNENKERGEKLAAKWAEKKQLARQGVKVSRRGPSWTIWNPDRKDFDLDGKKAEVICRIFQDCIDGLGITAISSRLNREKVEPFVTGTDGWHQHRVLTILRSPSVCGYYQPTLTTNRPGQRMLRVAEGDAIADYYPRIISDDVFNLAQDRIARRNKRGGGKGKRGKLFPNLLIGVGRCEECFGTLILGSRHNSQKVRHYRCYQQSRAHRCNNISRYLTSDVEDRLRFFLIKGRLEEHVQEADLYALRVKLAEIEGIKRAIKNLVDAIEKGGLALAERAHERQIELKGLEREADELRASATVRQKRGTEATLREAAEWLTKVQDETDATETFKHRSKANALLNDLFDWIIPTANGLWLGSSTTARWVGDNAMSLPFDIPADLKPTAKALANYRGETMLTHGEAMTVVEAEAFKRELQRASACAENVGSFEQ